MKTRVVSSFLETGPFGFRSHLRLIIGGLVMTLIVIAISAPSRVQSVAPMFVNPPALQVTATSSNSITLGWSVPAGSDEYAIERGDSMSGPFKNINFVAGTTFTDTLLTNQKAYVYRVRAIDNSGTDTLVSDPSNMAVGVTIAFEFSQLLGQTIKARHVHDVRTAVNALRRVAHLPELTLAPDNLTGDTVTAFHVLDLRTSLGQALAALNISHPAYTDSTLSTGVGGTLVKAVHIEELQARSSRGSSNSAGPLYPHTSRAIGGEFGPMDFLPLVAVHLSVLPDRRILFWGRDMLVNTAGEVKQRAGSSDAYVWNMANGQMLHVPNTRTNLFCSGHSFLPDGNLLVTGGHRSAHFDAAGEAHTNIFNYNTSTWSAGPSMNHGRWYPYNVTINTGEPVIMAGSYWANEPPFPHDPYNPNVAPPPPASRSILTNTIPQSYTPVQGGGLKELAAPSSISQYPFLHLLTNGKVFQAQTGFVGSSTPDRLSRLFDPVANIWSDLPSTQKPHAMGTSAMFVDDTVMVIGGFGSSFAPVPDVESINLAVPSPNWTLRESMKFPRVYHTATLLPDGKVLVSGGVACPGSINIQTVNVSGFVTCSAGQVLTPELWDPQTGKWTTMNKHSDVRAYHSVAALLPDGRVLVGGGGLPGAVGETGLFGAPITNVNQDWARLFGHNSIEIFSPPYLFNANGNPAARPVITSAPPASATYGETFFVGTSGAGLQPKVSLVRLPSVTHGTNQDQRLISIDPLPVSGGIHVTIPTSPSKVPPGHYMLFVLNNGVPSVAAIVRVQNQHLFPTAVPQTTASGDMQTWEQGVEFSSSVNGQITHIRFWKAPGEPSGNHIGRIWTANGMLLASALFTNETASGWQEAQLQTPLPITANVRYKATYNVHAVIAKTFDVFSNPITSGPLVAWGSSFSTPAGSFPTTGSMSNLFVDVRFK
jgi:Domain of unknown function (DUF4082)/Domain of unknown function (DUF1929)